MDRLDEQLHTLHQNGLMILTNVADAAGARLVEQLGNKAVSTSSAAVAWVRKIEAAREVTVTTSRLSPMAKSMRC
jgi:2-methylisocitrate lyase-like PEP mutase family enzyme